MADFSITLDDGRKLKIDADNEPAAASAARQWQKDNPRTIMQKLTGSSGDRYQLWPERLARSIGQDVSNLVTTFPEVASGRIDINTPEGMQQAVNRVTPGVTDLLPTAPAVGLTTSIARQAAVPTAKELLGASKATYEGLKKSDTMLNPIGLDSVHDAIAGALEGENWFGDINAPNTFKLLGKLKGREGPQSFGEVQKIRDSLDKVGGADEDKAAANYAKRLIDDYMTRVPEQHVVSGDPVRDAALVREAAANYRGAKRTEALTGEEIGSVIERAERQAGSRGTGWNLGNTLRQRINAILNSQTEQHYFTKPELQELRKIVVGSRPQNILRDLGKRAPTGSVSTGMFVTTLLGLTGAHNTAGTVATGVGGTGAVIAGLLTLAHFAENAVTKSAIRKVAEGIRRDTPLARSMPASAPYNPLLPQVGVFGAADALLQSRDDSLR